MNGRRNNRAKNNELPIPARAPDASPPEARIELAPPPDIDIAQDRIGVLFTERRRAMGLKIEEIGEDIKVKPDYLRAIEQERFDLLPTPEYARLFIKAYAERLGFNLSEVFALLDVTVTLAPPPPKPKIGMPLAEPVRRTPPPDERGAPGERTMRGPLVVWGSVALIVLAVAIVGWVAIKGGKAKEPAGTEGEKTPASKPAVATPEPAPDQEDDSLPITSTAETAGPMNLGLQFAVDTWASLEADHDTIVSGVIKAGQRIDASAVESFVLSLGHTNGVALTMNGQTVNRLSTWGRRLNHFLITQDSVRSWLGPSQVESGASSSDSLRQPAVDTGGRR